MIKNNQITKKTHGLEARRRVFLVLAIISIVLFSVNFVDAATTVTLNSPPNYLNNSFNTVNFNCSASDDVTYLSNISLWTNSTGTWHRNETETAYLNDTYDVAGERNYEIVNEPAWNIYESQAINSYVLNYTNQWKRAGTSSGKMIIEFVFSNGTKLNSSEFTTSSTSYSNVFITNPSISSVSPFGWNVSTINVYLNDNSGDNTFIKSTVVTFIMRNSTQINKIYPFNLTSYNVWNCQACNVDGSCSFAASNYSIHQGLNVSSVSYNTSTLQTSTETFLLQLAKLSAISSINATLYYNGTPYASTTTISGNQVNISNTLSIPANISGDIIFYWEITSFGTLGSTTQILGNYTQEVTNFTIYSCTGASPSGLTLNFTLYDESSKNKINGSFESTFTYFMIGGSGTTTQSYNYQSINENKSNWMFCINSSGYNVSFSGTASYYADYYDRREYIFSNATVGNFTQNIPLYLSLIADTDVVTVTVQDQNYNPISGALVYIQEWNVGTNTYSTIGMFFTDSNGNGIINLELYNKWYRAVVSIDGEIVKTTDVQKLADTTWFINVELATANPYELFDSISHGLTFDNETNITTFVWTDGSGYIQSGCLYIYNNTNTGYSLIHSECVSSVAGIINYLLPGDGDYQVVGTIYLTPDYNVSKVTDVLFVQIGVPELTRIVSPFGKILTFLFVGVATFLGVSVGSPIWGSMLLIGSLFLTFKLGWIKLSSAILWGLLSVVIVIIFRQKRRVG